MIDALIFSKNRPMQLHCLLSSLKEYSNIPISKIKVLYRYDEEYVEGFKKLQNIHKEVKFIKEENFELQVKEYLRFGEKYCVFFVDDILIKDEINFSIPCDVLDQNPHMLCFSLRLGTHLTDCYPTSTKQLIPNGTINSQFFIWGWKNAPQDWGYPLSVDGHIFRRNELEGWSSHLRFKNPNQFESSLQEIPRTFAIPLGMVCHVNSKLFNNPVNRVQDEFQNRVESSVSPQEFNKLWNEGFEINYSEFKGYLNPAAHTPVKFSLRKS